MKKFLLVLVVLIMAFGSSMTLAAYAGDATDDLGDVYADTSSFDGGSGSGINCSPAAEDSDEY